MKLVFVLVVLLACAEAAKIVAMPYPGGASHVFIMSKIGVELASRNHEVVLVVAEMDSHHATSRTAGSNVKVLPYDAGYNKSGIDHLTLECTKQSPLDCTVTITQTCISACRQLLLNEQVLASIVDADLVLADIAYPCGYTFADKYNIPFRAEVSPVGFYDPWGAMHWGIPSDAASIPQLGSKLTNQMTYSERLLNTIIQGVLYGLTPTLDALADGLRNEFGISRSHTASARASGTYIVNVDWATEFPRPVTPVTHVVGPILPEIAKPLPQDLEAWMQSSPKGVLLVSLGTLAEVVLSQETIDTLSNVFASLTVNVLWKLSRAAPAKVSPNVKIVSWFPQNDLLGHEKTIAFFTHGGMNSVQEAAFHGVPMLGFPQFADQFDNIIRMVVAGTCIEVRAEQFSQEKLHESIITLIEDPKYRANARKVLLRMRDRARTPTEEAADWIEFAMRNENCRHLRVPTLDMSWYQAANLDVLGTFAALAFFFLWLLVRLLSRFVPSSLILATFVVILGYFAFAKSN